MGADMGFTKTTLWVEVWVGSATGAAAVVTTGIICCCGKSIWIAWGWEDGDEDFFAPLACFPEKITRRLKYQLSNYCVVFLNRSLCFFAETTQQILIKTTDISSCWQDPSFLFSASSLITNNYLVAVCLWNWRIEWTYEIGPLWLYEWECWF